MKLCCSPLPRKRQLPPEQKGRTIGYPVVQALPPGMVPLYPVRFVNKVRTSRNQSPKPPRRQISSLTMDRLLNKGCMFLQQLPLELRLIIYSYVIGNDKIRLITVPWKVVAAPDIEGNVSMTHEHITAFHSRRPDKRPRFYGNALLQTCRQIYQEAVDVLYSTNTFILLDFPTFDTFAKSILPQRLNAIRSLQIRYSPTKSISYQHECTGHYDLPNDLDSVWETILRMKNLQNLELDFEAYSRVWKDDHERENSEIHRLSPLLSLRGLSSFQLELIYLNDGDHGNPRAEPYAPALRQAIFEGVRRPRIP